MRIIEYKDRTDEGNAVHLALGAVGLDVTYETSELIRATLTRVLDLGLKMTLKDTAKIKLQHERKWDDYFKSKTK
jgi:hypothetical protein